jgi:hypothetical protein
MKASIGATKSVVLSIGEDFHLKLGKDHIAYAGMPSEEVYSIAQKKGSGYQGFAWNLYYPKRKRDITIDGVRLYVERVTPDEIELRVA